MPDNPPIIEYASPAPKKLPAIVWWFLFDAAILFGGVGYMMIAYEDAGPYNDLPPRQGIILTVWMLTALGLFLFLLGWAAWGWWSRRAK